MNRKENTGIIPECYVDTNLTETLTGIVCNHQKGCANVVKQMNEKQGDRFALGIIDRDKRAVGYVSEFLLIAGNESLQVLKHKSRPHYLIYIIPAIEGFVLRAVEELNIVLSDFGLPAGLMELKQETKQQDSKRDPRFVRLFQALKDASGPQTLRSVVEYLHANPYSADPNEIERLISVV